MSLSVETAYRLYTHCLKGISPFDVKIGNLKFLVQAAETVVQFGIKLMLKLGTGGITEEYPAAEGAYSVYPAQIPNLEWASPITFFCRYREDGE